MQILTRRNRVIDYCADGYMCMGCTVVCESKGVTFEECTVVTVDEVPADIDQYDYYYVDGTFVKDEHRYTNEEIEALVADSALPDSLFITRKGTKIASTGMQAIAYGNGVYVAVGGSGASYSTDGTNWAVVDVPDGWKCSVVTFGNGMFVARGHKYHAYSTDGINWTGEADDVANAAKTIVYGGGKFVAASMWSDDSTHGFGYSTDGITWSTAEFSEVVDYFSADCIAYGNGVFVVSSYTNNRKVAYSTDGITWSRADSALRFNSGIAYGNGVFVQVGGDGIEYSSDGQAWTAVDTPAKSLTSIAFGKGIFVAVSVTYGQVWYSSDGISWSCVYPNLTPYYANVVFANDRFIYTMDNFGSLAYSTNGTSWFAAKSYITTPDKTYDLNYSLPNMLGLMKAANAQFVGPAYAGGTQDIGTAQVRNIYAGTTDMTPGSTALTTGTIYVMYE